MNLPKRHFSHDKTWIAEQLGKLNPAVRDKVVRRYSEVYEATYDESVVSYQKDGFARREANTRLRIFVDKFGASARGETKLPPRRL